MRERRSWNHGLLKTGSVAAAWALAATAGRADPLSAGALVAVQVGDGSAALSAAATPVFFKELSPVDGSVIQVIALPTTPSGPNAALTLSGTATSEGFVTLATNAQWLLLGGYNAAVGTASVASTASTAVPRVVARLGLDGTLNLTTILPDAYSGSNIRSAASTDGIDIWTGGNAGSGQAATGGVRYTTLGSSASVQLSSAVTNTRVVNIFNGQLYVSTASGAFNGIGTVGSGTPTTGGQTISLLPGFPAGGTSPSPYDFFFASPTVLYVADDRTFANGGGVQRWDFTGTTWVNTYSFSLGTQGARGLTGKVVSGTTTLYATATSASGNGLYVIVDNGPGSPATLLTSAPTNTAFRGVRVLPGTFGQPPTGACCFPNGSCAVTTAAGCASQGGVFQGLGTDCSTISCPQPGACCFADGTCLVLPQASCTSAGGVFQGSATTCAAVNCGPRTGACCLPSLTCTVATAASCAAQGGVYRGDGTGCGTTACTPTFGSGSLIVLAAGDGSPLGTSANAAPVFLTEIRIADGAVLQSIRLPATPSDAGNRAVTHNATSTTEGSLSRSTDGRFLLLAGYNAPVGTPAVAGTTVPRVVARIDGQGIVNTTTAFTDGSYSGGSFRSAASTSGTDIWTGGDAPVLADRGVRYTTLGSNASLQLSTDVTNIRVVKIFHGQLYAATASGAFTGVNRVGTGLPTTSGQVIVNLAPNADAMDFFFASPTVLYTASRAGGTGAAGIQKWTFDGIAWTLAYTLDGGGTITVPVQHLTGATSGGLTVLYGTLGENATTGGNRLVSVVDTGPASPFSTIATAPANVVWKGVQFPPVAGPACYANCDGSTAVPFLNVADFTCFLQAFAAGCSSPSPCYANCDGSTAVPFLNVADFTCFLQAFAAGCSAP